MKVTYLDYGETQSFSAAIIRYIEDDPLLRPFVSHRPDIQNFEPVIKRGKPNVDREVLVEVLRDQYRKLKNPCSTAVSQNIKLLLSENTYTVTTGHQLNIFTGPLYFIYKIVSTIKLARELAAKYPDSNFVPVYWMATEDHDFAEINHTWVSGKKLVWEREAAGCTGQLNLDGIESLLREFSSTLGISKHADELRKLALDAYSGHGSLADATREFVNGIFQIYGLVIIDADDHRLKSRFAGVMARDIEGRHSASNIAGTNKALADIGIESQVNPREINFFYTSADVRERIIFENGIYQVLNTDLKFDAADLRQEIDNHPERFSPNVVMRPLYQEIVLPNLAYIGGAAEIVYWLQLKTNFDFYKVDFPILLLRNSALIANFPLKSKLESLGIDLQEIFKKPDDIQRNWVLNHSDLTLDLSQEWQEFGQIFDKIKARAIKVDPTLAPSTEAVQARLHHAIQNLEKKLIKAEKRNYSDVLGRIGNLKEKLFPGGSIQERKENFAPFYVRHGADFIEQLLDAFQPLEMKFTVLEEEQE